LLSGSHYQSETQIEWCGAIATAKILATAHSWEGEPLQDIELWVRDGLFLAASRTYAEQYIEPIVRSKFDLLEPTSDDHDAVGYDGTRFEIKASKVLRKRSNGKGEKPLLDRVIFEATDSQLKRYFESAERYEENYNANIQNVKRDHFDKLIYVLLFSDCLKIFSADSGMIRKGSFASWSDKHGRYDEHGKSGQFPISKENIKWHEDNNFELDMSYFEATKILEDL
jgi:hypothetical protein